MATIKNTQITVGQIDQNNKVKVTVTSALEFVPADTGTWKVSIGLYGDDSAEGGGQKLLYTFKFGPNLLFKKDYKTVQATPGVVNVSESRFIDWGTLDEDPGSQDPQNAPPGTQGPPFKDEVFALVTLGREAKSNVWDSGFGV